MHIKEVVLELINYYSSFETLLKHETDALIQFDIPKFRNIVNEKIELLTTITEYEQQRVVQFGEKTLDELINTASVKDEEILLLKEELKTIITSIKEMNETNQLLMEQINNYSQKVIGAIVEQGKENVTYNKTKRFATKDAAISLLNKSI